MAVVKRKHDEIWSSFKEEEDGLMLSSDDGDSCSGSNSPAKGRGKGKPGTRAKRSKVAG